MISFVWKIFLLAFVTFFILSSAFLEQEINRSLPPHVRGSLRPPCPTPLAPQPRELIAIEEESERLARELKEVSDGADKSKTILCCLISVLSKEDKFSGLIDFYFYLCVSYQVSRNRDSLRAQMNQLCQYRGVLTRTHSLTASQVLKALISAHH